MSNDAFWKCLLLLPLGSIFTATIVADEGTSSAQNGAVSYHKEIRPLFQARCHGCHQPAKASGDYVMTTFDHLLSGGESEMAAIVPGKADDSYLVELITPVDGEASMPQDGKPLSDSQIAMIAKWIAQGAENDSPSAETTPIDAEHPPVYTHPSAITSLDFSPDGQLLAVAGYHEVLLHKADGSGLVARLVGMSERIESIAFSPDGKRLAVTGGLPARSGELQVWDVATHTLCFSLNAGFDTAYGVAWSPDGTQIAFGCADNSIRAIDAKTGEQILYQGAHSDWPLDTVFSAKGTHVISVGRDRTVKLTEIATQRFVDNITSITPGALKGGIAAVARHPERDEVLVGGADGEPKLYRVFRTSKRVIGDDANLIRKFPPLKGRIFDVAISPDGSRIAAGSCVDRTGEVHIYAYDFDASVPKDLLAIMQKRVASRSAEEKKKIADHHTKGVHTLAETEFPESGIFALAFSPDGKRVAAGGTDGKVRMIDTETGSVTTEFVPVPVDALTVLASQERLASQETPTPVKSASKAITNPTPSPAKRVDESLPKEEKLVSIAVQPARTRLAKRLDTVQFVVTGHLESGQVVDVTRLVRIEAPAEVLDITPNGLVRGKQNGQADVQFTLGDTKASAVVEVDGMEPDFKVDLIRDVMPVFGKAGCNAGVCHGSKKGKGGLKTSMRGNDPVFEIRAYRDELASRRINMASPENSLMLLKPTTTVPHQGGQVIVPGSPYYQIIYKWIADGAHMDLEAPRVDHIELFPKNRILQKTDARQQFRVVATYRDGKVRDVTSEAHLSSGNIEVATADSTGLVTVQRRGESSILARFEGKYAATTLTVMGDREGFVWKEPPANNFIDALVAEKLQRTKTLPSPLCTDAEFLRRTYLDLIGLPPTADEIRAFLADTRDTRTKRNDVIDRLIGSKDFVEHWTNKWADLLQVNRKYLAPEGAALFRKRLRDQIDTNTPYDQFVYSILTSGGSNRENPAASYFKILRTPEDTVENTTQLFLGIRFSCNKCHDHPFEKWVQNDYWETAAYFARVGLKKDPAGGDKQIGKTAVEAGKPLYEIVFDKEQGEVLHDETGAVTPPKFPFRTHYVAAPNASRREHLARWLIAPDNPYFARSYVNRIWGYLLGQGFIEPLDDIRASNPPTNPELLARLTENFIASGFDVRHLMRTICQSRTYQLSINTNRWNEDDAINYSHARARRLPAEVLYDALHLVTGSVSKIPGVTPGTRAAELPDAGVKEPSGFLAKFGRPARESACECERSRGMQFGPVMALVSGSTVDNAINDPKGTIAKLVAAEKDDAKLVNELFVRILNRPAELKEIELARAMMRELPDDHKKLVAGLREWETQLASKIAAQEKQRQAKIAAAQEALQSYENEIGQREQELDRQQNARIAQAEESRKSYEATIQDQLAAWEAKEDRGTAWIPLDPTEVSSTSAATLAKQEDLSVLATGSNGLGAYRVVASTDLTGIRAVRIEALADDRQPMKGPGRAPDGNFVLTEFEVSAAPKSDPSMVSKVELENAQADFSQNFYDVASAIDGKMEPAGNGWAISPKKGETHLASFETRRDVGFEGGTILTLQLHQNFSSGQHSLGRFRLSVTTTPGPILLDGLPQNVIDILAVAPDKRDKKQKADLLAYYRSIDGELKKRNAALAEARKPRPIDPKLQALRDQLAVAKRPIPTDPKLAQLQADVKLSAKLLKNARLTAAQDIAWALINSPAFLFNR